MRYFRIFALHFQDAFQSRGRSFVWFLVALINPLIYFAFWGAALREHGEVYGDWNKAAISSYYFLVAVATSFLITHIEESVAREDIQQGGLVKYLVRPFSYFQFKFFQEIPWRIIQGTYTVCVFGIFWLLSSGNMALVSSPPRILLGIFVVFLALVLSYIFKMIVGLTAFWTTDFRGVQNFFNVILFICAGYITPIAFYPQILQRVAYNLPFAYIVYFPVVSLQGRLTEGELFGVIGTQVVYILLLYLLYRLMWSLGLRKFVGVGQ